MLITFLSILAISYSYKIRNSLIFTLCVWGALIFFSTEIFSLFHILNRQYVLYFWTISALFCGSWCCWRYRKQNMEIRHIITKYDILNVIFIAWILLLGVTAFLMVPNNYDSMTYHLARVANWVQNESVSYYPTNIERQLYSPVWAEYVILHTYLLIGSDTVANMVQFFAYVLSSILIYMIATKLNFHRIIKYMMVILFITIPMAIAQSVTTQTDLVATLWLLALVNIALDLVQLKSLTFNKDSFVLIFEGATVCALAFLSKSSVCLGICFFLLWIAFQYIRAKYKFLPLCVFGVMATVIVASFVLPTFYRNYNYTGDIFASDYMGKIAIGNYHPKYVLLNLAKNYALLATAPMTHGILSSAVNTLSDFLNIDVNHPDISWTNNYTQELSYVATSFHHDFVSCPLVSGIWLICCIIFCCVVWFKSKKINNKLFILTCILAVCAGLISLRYQIWGCRVLLPYCALMTIVIGWTINLLIQFKQKTALCIIFCISIAVIPTAWQTLCFQLNYLALENKTSRYFLNQSSLYPAYEDLIEYINLSNTQNIGLYIGGDSFEYPIWQMLPNKKIIHIVPDNKQGVVPDYIIAINRDIEPLSSFMYLEKEYRPVYFYNGNKQFAILALKSVINPSINFTSTGNVKRYQIEGLSGAENTHSWSNSSQVVVNFKKDWIKYCFDINKPLTLQVFAFPFLGGKITAQTVKVYANDSLIATWLVNQEGEYKAIIPASVLTSENIALRFDISNPMSPKNLGLSEDSRLLGIAFKTLTLSQEEVK